MDSQPRKVLEIVEPQTVLEGAGVRLTRSMATRRLDYLDPFLLFDHFGSDNPDDYLAGFPMHPHRGIETVTYMLAGVVHHRVLLLRLPVPRHSERAQRVEESLPAMARAASAWRFLDSLQSLRPSTSLRTSFLSVARNDGG